ncbi:MAG TPA: short-chain dehydrogenase [Dehalococcoidia bacterium]|nr:short-chain dehydrogenase [Dehalococcoidia bacterium]|tara:strand:- start:18455 stop:19255 length:801 start_codon:yes stop_codon:yes gene_type:complete
MSTPLVVVITGASAGIGRATAIRFARERASLVLAARSQEILEQLAENLEQRYEIETLVVQCDVRNHKNIDSLIEAAIGKFGRIDVLVNNAGYGLYGRIEDTPEQAFRDVIETNVLAVHHTIRLVLPHMRQQGSGHIVNVGSIVGKRSWPYHGAYAASKFALTGLTQALRGELAGSGVTTTLVLPASTETEFFAKAQTYSPEYAPAPLGPVQKPDQVARTIVQSVRKPSPEQHLQPLMRIAHVLADAFPGLTALASEIHYRLLQQHR